ncbi:MAG: WGR domain-containing protein [Magnetococcales bacterium]|nr:WGR domain-containing protein [Magnetococcales bacterium]
MKAYLQRVNQESQLIWYYFIQVQPDLLGRWQVIREWGRLGSPGTVRKTPYPDPVEALNALQILRDQLIQKGYRVVMQEGLKQSMADYVREGA